MSKSRFVILFLCLSINLYFSTDGIPMSIENDFEEHERFERGLVVAPDGVNETQAAPKINQCPAGADSKDTEDTASTVETIPDPSNSQCMYEKRAKVVLKALKDEGSGSNLDSKLLQSTFCASEEDCLKKCNDCKCKYFMKQERDNLKTALAYFYTLNTEKITDDDYAKSDMFVSYVHGCKSAKARAKRAGGGGGHGPPNKGGHSGPKKNDHKDSKEKKKSKEKVPKDPHDKMIYSKKLGKRCPPLPSVYRKRRHHEQKHEEKKKENHENKGNHGNNGNHGNPGHPGGGHHRLRRGKPFDPNRIVLEEVDLLKRDRFKKFTKDTCKTYEGEEYNKREDIFYDNLETIKKKNEEQEQKKDAKPDDSKYEATHFTDLTFTEFLQHFTGALPEPHVPPLQVPPQQVPAIQMHPPDKDWRADKRVSEVRYQGSCGSCYAFSISDLFAVQNAVDGTQPATTLSPQHIMDCFSDGRGCQGARVGLVINNILNTTGVPLEQCNTYKQQAGQCPTGGKCCAHKNIKWFERYDASGPQERDLIASLLVWGPLITIVEASEAWMYYNGTGVIKANQCPEQKQNHAVSIVGYNYDAATPYYIIKNSWSTAWGDGGFGKLEAGTNACQVSKAIFTACARGCDKIKDTKSRLANPPKNQTIPGQPHIDGPRGI